MSQTHEPWQFTSESVSEGHPDKVADRISDEVLDACLRLNPHARVAIETLVTDHRCLVAGQLGGVARGEVDVARCVRESLRELGYCDGDFAWEPDELEVLLHEQSREIASAVGDANEGAGDQGLMFGYACRETPELMPAALLYSHRILERLAAHRRGGEPRLGPDAKAQLTLTFEGDRPVHLDTVVVSHQSSADFADGLRWLVRSAVADVVPDALLSGDTDFKVNPSGSFVVGGPAADTGLTGRKIVVDTYGGAAPHGGGAFSGKDPSKVDRTGAYAARWLAKNVVAAGLAERCQVQLAYAIGIAEPVSLGVQTFGTGTRPDPALTRTLRNTVDLRPRALRERLELDRPIYARTAAYGHFGRAPEPDGGFSWERTDLARELDA